MLTQRGRNAHEGDFNWGYSMIFNKGFSSRTAHKRPSYNLVSGMITHRDVVTVTANYVVAPLSAGQLLILNLRAVLLADGIGLIYEHFVVEALHALAADL